MHCAASYGRDDTGRGVLFGLSGTGKTTSPPTRSGRWWATTRHGWSDRGVFTSRELHAKVINLPRDGAGDPPDDRMIRDDLENVGDGYRGAADRPERRDPYGEYARFLPALLIPRVDPARRRHPKHIVMLTADAFGVLPADLLPLDELTTLRTLVPTSSPASTVQRWRGAALSETVATRGRKVSLDVRSIRARIGMPDETSPGVLSDPDS